MGKIETFFILKFIALFSLTDRGIFVSPSL